MTSMTQNHHDRCTPMPRALRERRPNIAAQVEQIVDYMVEERLRREEIARKISIGLDRPEPRPTLTVIHGGDAS